MQQDFCLQKLPFLIKIGSVTTDIESEYLIKPKSSNWQKIIELSCNLIQSSVTVLQLCGYQCLKQMCQKLVVIDAQSVNQHNPHGILLPKLEKTLLSIQDVLHAMLMDFR